MGKRHFKGNNKGESKRAREDKAAAWKAQPEGDRNNDSRARSTNNNSYVNNRGDWGLSVFSDVSNARMAAFYKAQMPFLTGDVATPQGPKMEFEVLLDTLRLPLPACFRISTEFAFKDEMERQLTQFAGETMTIDTEEGRKQMPAPPTNSTDSSSPLIKSPYQSSCKCSKQIVLNLFKSNPSILLYLFRLFSESSATAVWRRACSTV
jgi:hypothetical protein